MNKNERVVLENWHYPFECLDFKNASSYRFLNTDNNFP